VRKLQTKQPVKLKPIESAPATPRPPLPIPYPQSQLRMEQTYSSMYQQIPHRSTLHIPVPIPSIPAAYTSNSSKGTTTLTLCGQQNHQPHSSQGPPQATHDSHPRTQQSNTALTAQSPTPEESSSDTSTLLDVDASKLVPTTRTTHDTSTMNVSETHNAREERRSNFREARRTHEPP